MIQTYTYSPNWSSLVEETVSFEEASSWIFWKWFKGWFGQKKKKKKTSQQFYVSFNSKN